MLSREPRTSRPVSKGLVKGGAGIEKSMWTQPGTGRTPSLPSWTSWDQLRSELSACAPTGLTLGSEEYQSLQVLELVSQLEELSGGEQDSIEGVHHGGRELEVLLPKQDVCHRVEDVLCIQ